MEINFYQSGGIGVSPDENTLHFISQNHIRTVNLVNGEAATLAPRALATIALRGLAVGASGTLYLSDWGNGFYAVKTDNTVERRALDGLLTNKAQRHFVTTVALIGLDHPTLNVERPPITAQEGKGDEQRTRRPF